MQVMVNVPDAINQAELQFRIKEFENDLASKFRNKEEQISLGELLCKLRSKKTFRNIKDPVAWQRETRRDRALPDR